MHQLLQRPVKQKYHCGQNRHAADNAEDNALCHDNAEILSESEGHEAERDESCNGRYGTSDNACQCCTNCCRHGVLRIGMQLPLLVVAVPEEDGVVHRDRKLKHGGKSLCDVRNLAEEVVCAHVQQDHHAD